MKYRDLVQFDPIETVVQLRDADRRSEAERLVHSYVISDRMAELLERLVIPQLQHNTPADNRGLFIVGNYGTGKSHLLSVLSAVAEYDDLLPYLTHAGVATSFKQIAGQFRVVRAEIGTTTMRLRDILLGILEMALADLGVDYSFPAIDQVTNSKDMLMEMMATFDQHYPGQGLLLVVDEMLDYLRSRQDQALVLDLSFLRELGEISRNTRFRFVAGIQESIFDSPRFQFVADAVRRVKDRFEQVRIAREDVAFVVAARLLKKNPEQKQRVRQHLRRFTRLYGNMAEKLDDFVNLFPVHPAYLEKFERIHVAEKREVLKTLSTVMQDRLDQAVPQDEPGLIAYDSYWTNLRDNPSFRSVPEIKEVIDKSQVLEDRVSHALPYKAYKPAAIRLIHALSVHRLTTGDIYAPLGATSEELRDDLALFVAGLPEAEADFLRSTIDSVLEQILKTVSGQFISFNSENGQYFLDLKKDIDFDALIQQRAESLDSNQLDRYYFTALAEVMECPQATYVPGFRIWFHEVEWRERRVKRPGYLFFGAPNERSTAQPPREFYLYVLQPHHPPPFTDQQLADEVFFRLARPDAEFQQTLKLYAGAREMAGTASGDNRQQYERKAIVHLRTLQKWLRDNLARAMDVTHAGVTRPLVEWVQAGATPYSTSSVRDLVEAVASTCLAPTFASALPDYPTFKILITQANRVQAAGEAIRWLAGNLKTQQGGAVLDALGLFDNQNHIRVHNSRYATHFLTQLTAKGEGQVLNRAEIITGPFDAEYDLRFKLEPEWVVVTLLAMVYSGDITLALPGRTLDSSNLEDAVKLNLDDLASFKFIRPPKGIPVAALTELFELLGLPPGQVKDTNQHQTAVEQLAKQVAGDLNQLVLVRQKAQDGLPLWEANVLEGPAKAELLRQLDAHKSFLESLQAYNQPGKLRNFRYSAAEVQAQAEPRRMWRQVQTLAELVAALQPLTAYLGVALAVLPPHHEWSQRAKTLQQEQLAHLRHPANWSQPTLRATLAGALERLKADYIELYLNLHRRSRLTPLEDDRKKRLLNDPRRQQLTALANLQFLPVASLQKWEQKLIELRPCFALGESDLKERPFCDHCQYRPVAEEPPAQSLDETLAELEEELGRLHAAWTGALLTTLAQETPQQTIELMTPAQRQHLTRFLEQRALPEKISAEFSLALTEALGGLQKISVPPEDILLALTEGGTPCTVQELQRRFNKFVTVLTSGGDPNKVRIVIEW